MKKNSSGQIALAAISCALATVFLLLGLWVPPALAAGYFAACFCMMIPLSRDGYVGCALSAIGCVLLTCLLGGFGFFWKILPFAVFFAWHPLVNKLQKKNGRLPWLWWAIKAAWFDGMLFLAYFVTFEMNVSFDWLNAYIVPVLLVGGTLGFLVYDKLMFLCQRSVDALVRRIGRK